MEMTVTFPKGAQVQASFEGYTVLTDQPEPEGSGAAPTPFNLFLASIGTCVGYYVMSYCQHHGIPSEKMSVTLQSDRNTSSHLVEEIKLTVHVPRDFPDKYSAGVIRAAGSCLVKKHMENPPKFSVTIAKS